MIVSQQPSAQHIREEGDARHPHPEPSQWVSQLVAVRYGNRRDEQKGKSVESLHC
jgi:hypothetical protein